MGFILAISEIDTTWFDVFSLLYPWSESSILEFIYSIFILIYIDTNKYSAIIQGSSRKADELYNSVIIEHMKIVHNCNSYI